MHDLKNIWKIFDPKYSNNFLTKKFEKKFRPEMFGKISTQEVRKNYDPKGSNVNYIFSCVGKAHLCVKNQKSGLFRGVFNLKSDLCKKLTQCTILNSHVFLTQLQYLRQYVCQRAIRICVV